MDLTIPTGTSHVSIFSEMSALAQAHDAINLGQGFPDFSPPEDLLNIIGGYLSKPVHQYAPMAGNAPLRQTIAEKVFALYGLSIDASEQVTITAGATQALFTAIAAMIKPGDEVIIFEPAYDSYRPAIEQAGGKVVAIQLGGYDFSIPWEEVKATIGKRTRLMIINSPHNPTGIVMTRGDIDELLHLVRTTDLMLLSDEVYEHIVFDGREHMSVLREAELFERSLAVFSFGKTFHCTGWKMGYCIGPTHLMKRFRTLHQWVVFSVNSFLQPALAEYMHDMSRYSGLSSFFEQKRDLFCSRLSGTGLIPVGGGGTYFQLVDYSQVSQREDTEFAKWLTTNIGVAAIPVSVFSSVPSTRKLLRFCFAKSEATIEEAGRRLRYLSDCGPA